MYWEESGTINIAGGPEVTIKVQHVDIEPEVAKRLFDQGEQVGDWHWKHQIWRNVPAAVFPTVQAAARFYYGWAEGSETVTENPDGTVTYEAYYAAG